jgi:glucose-1-phosphate adenylyltransferase
MPPAKFVEGGIAQESIVGSGVIVAGSTVRSSVLSGDVKVLNGAYVEGSVILPGVQIGKGAVIRRAILDKNVIVPPGATIGLDLDHDKQHYHVTDGGVVVLGKGQEVAT